jgi:hypothetical protein
MGRLSDFTPVEADFPDLADVPAAAEFTFVADGKDYNVTLAQMPELLGVGAVPSDDGGDVVGPTGATTGHAVVFNGATGKVVASAGAAPALIGHTQLLATITDAGNAASKNVGTTAGTVAAGDDSRFDAAAPIASPTLTGTPAAPTAAQGTDTTQIATTAFVVAEITAVALTDGAGAAAAIATEAGVSTVWSTDDAGDPAYLVIDNVDEATLADLLEGTEGVIPSAATLKAAREWTALSVVAGSPNLASIAWNAELNRTISTAADFTVTFAGLDTQVGDRLSGALYVTNTDGSTITITFTDGDGDPDAPTVLPDATTIDVTAGDTALIHFETLPDGTVFVVHRITI